VANKGGGNVRLKKKKKTRNYYPWEHTNMKLRAEESKNNELKDTQSALLEKKGGETFSVTEQ